MSLLAVATMFIFSHYFPVSFGNRKSKSLQLPSSSTFFGGYCTFEKRVLTLSVQFCRGFSSGVGYVGTAEADIVLVPGHRVVVVKVLDMVMVMVNVLVMVITMVMVMEWMVRTIGDSKRCENDNCEAFLTSSYIMAYGLISAITW